MIYLFDDRKGRKDDFLKIPIDNKYIKESIFDSPQDKIIQFIFNNLEDAKCILFHKSYEFPQGDISVQEIKKIFISRKINFVQFSGGDNNNLLLEKNIYTATINSEDMYLNLEGFIKYYKQEKTINLPLLIFGKKYLLNNLLLVQHNIYIMTFTVSSSKPLNKNKIDDISDMIESDIEQKELAGVKKELLDYLKKNTVPEGITSLMLKQKIEDIIKKY